MSQVVHKQLLTVGLNVVATETPIAILSVGNDPTGIALWYRTELEVPQPSTRKVFVVMTGSPIPADLQIMYFIGTVTGVLGRQFVLHAFEVI
jgi:hypothetical protein